MTPRTFPGFSAPFHRLHRRGHGAGGRRPAGGTTAPTGGVFQAEGIPAATANELKQSISYKPPVSKNGYRLFACLELDGDGCGKKDHGEIAR